MTTLPWAYPLRQAFDPDPRRTDESAGAQRRLKAGSPDKRETVAPWTGCFYCCWRNLDPPRRRAADASRAQHPVAEETKEAWCRAVRRAAAGGGEKKGIRTGHAMRYVRCLVLTTDQDKQAETLAVICPWQPPPTLGCLLWVRCEAMRSQQESSAWLLESVAPGAYMYNIGIAPGRPLCAFGATSCRHRLPTSHAPSSPCYGFKLCFCRCCCCF